MRAMFTLTPPESKRLIAKATAKLDVVEDAMRDGLIIIFWGSTTARVAEEILGKEMEREKYLAGVIANGVTGAVPPEERLPVIVLEKGEPVDIPWREAIRKLSAGDVVIKGANAIDPYGNVGILVGDREGGTMGATLPIIRARGSYLVVPVGLEKFIPSLLDIDPTYGIDTMDISLGMPCGVITITQAITITEVEALELLADVEATPIAAGGLGDSQGSVVLVIEGVKEDVEKALEIVKAVKGERPLKVKVE